MFQTSAERGAVSFSMRQQTLLPKSFQTEFHVLEALYKSLPSKIDLTEDDNCAHDAQRLSYINKALRFLHLYCRADKSFLLEPLNPDELAFFEGIQLLNARRLLEHIAFTIFHWSGVARAKYKALLSPDPFTWETFEQLGGLMKVADSEWVHFIIRGISGQVAQRFMDEILSTEMIVEEALPRIIEEDVPKLIELFNYIESQEQDSTRELAAPRVELYAIKALTRRVIDAENLSMLLHYSDNHCTQLNHRNIVTRLRKQQTKGALYSVEVDDGNHSFKRKVNLKTTLGQHAALRRLERIGEMLTGKNFSSFLSGLDDSIDWQAFIIIRDVIAHQDEGDNKRRLDVFLQDEPTVIAVLGTDMDEFFLRLCQVVAKRDEALPSFTKGSIGNFWSEVLSHEKAVVAERHRQENKPVPRVAKEKILFFIDVLKQRGVTLDKQLQWLGILDGRHGLPDKRSFGELLQVLPSRQENRELYNQCKAIANDAVNPRTDLASREQARLQQQQAAQQRAQEKERRLSGLVNIRRVAKEFCMKIPTLGLSSSERVQAAIEALENIKRFMEEEEFVKMNFDYPNLDAWNAHQDEWTVMNFFARLLTNPEFNDAIEYNAAQLLQHLERIRDLPEAKGCRFLDKDYDGLRYLRNYVAHGNPLLEKQEYEPGKKPSIVSDRQRKVGPIMITLIFELLPFLKQVKQKMEQGIVFSPHKRKRLTQSADQILEVENRANLTRSWNGLTA